jgi:hypothetical protein
VDIVLAARMTDGLQSNPPVIRAVGTMSTRPEAAGGLGPSAPGAFVSVMFFMGFVS